jgi:phosphate starvation-inducible PhoH-like protein
LEKLFGVQIFVRQGGGQVGDFSLVVRGPGGKVDRAMGELEHLRDRRKQVPETAVGVLPPPVVPAALPVPDDTLYVTFQGQHIIPRTEHQKRYVDFVHKYDLVVAIGPAGTGKTFLSVACALQALQLGKVSRIVLTRPVVEAGERLGFLPGDLYEKISPYLKPLFDAFYVMLGPEKFRFLREEETIEIVPLAYMRGRTLDDAFIVLDEAQNTTGEQMKMFLTRLGSNSQMIVTGDVTQIDLPPKEKSGLVYALKILKNVTGISTIFFDNRDIVRHRLVKEIIEAYHRTPEDEKNTDHDKNISI